MLTSLVFLNLRFFSIPKPQITDKIEMVNKQYFIMSFLITRVTVLLSTNPRKPHHISAKDQKRSEMILNRDR